jgi:hypothetical protein
MAARGMKKRFVLYNKKIMAQIMHKFFSLVWSAWHSAMQMVKRSHLDNI